MIKDHKDWANALRDVSLLANSPVQQKDGKWDVPNRKDIWKSIGPRISDEHLNRLRAVAVEVLKEKDPQFDLEPSERYAAAIYGKVTKHSRSLRKGIAETLALLGSDPVALKSCSHGKAEGTAVLAVREILKDADAILWASLNDCVETLAEAAPSEFLDAVEKSLQKTPSPFPDVFAQESGGFAGRNYTCGLLWGLEALAWSPDYLSRVTVILGELAALNPGGNWANRPANSLVDIFLPWHPQTCADLPRRKAAIEALLREQTDVGWRLLLALLPTHTGSTSGTYKPRWRNFVPTDWSNTDVPKDYWDQVSVYAGVILDLAVNDASKLLEVIAYLPSLPPPNGPKLLEHFSSKKIIGLSDKERQPLWEALVTLTAKHHQFPEAKWAMPPDLIKKIEDIANLLAPKESRFNARRLFVERDWALYSHKGSFEEQEKELSRKREAAVDEILKAGGISAVLDFAREVESPWPLGIAFGHIAPETHDNDLLPNTLRSEEKALKTFAGGFVIGRYLSKGWPWVDSMLATAWTAVEKTDFLLSLPFQKEIWRRAEAVLGADAPPYWKNARVLPPAAAEEATEAAQKLLDCGRPQEALECINRLVWLKADFSPELAARALLEFLKVEGTSPNLSQYSIEELINWLQKHPPKDGDALFQVEWAYLPLLGEHHQAKPKTLENRLATSPKFFCELIQVSFQSDKVEAKDQKPTEEQRRIAKNAYRLLGEWTRVPGTNDDQTFDGAAFSTWLAEARRICTESGHLSIAIDMIGKVLPFAPTDPDGLWIHRSVAEALNAKDSEGMRDGFTCKLFNMRGAHGFTAGKEERAIAAAYHKKADALDEKGYQRIASALRDFAKSFERDAERESKRDPFKD
jgi:hypothetical protein